MLVRYNTHWADYIADHQLEELGIVPYEQGDMTEEEIDVNLEMIEKWESEHGSH